MSEVSRLLEFVRQQRKLVGEMEATLQKAICDLLEAQHMEARLRVVDSDQIKPLTRGLAHKKHVAKHVMIRYNEEARTLFNNLLEYYEIGFTEPQTVDV